MIVELLIGLFTFFVTYLLLSHYKNHRKFKNNDLKFLSGVPIFGNTFNSICTRKHMLDDLNEVYKAFPDEKYVGYMEATTPVLMIRDPDLIKQITVKDFDYFTDHKQFFPEELEPLFGGSVLMLKGDRWRDMRTTLSPAFTGSKMRHMMPFIADICKHVVDYLKEQDTDSEIEVSDLIRRFTIDVIASAAFGVNVNSIKEKNNEFYELGQSIFKFSLGQRVMMFLAGTSVETAKFLKKFGFTMFPNKTSEFFKKLVSSTIEYRTKNNVERPDMIQLLMQATKGTLKVDKDDKEDSVGFATIQETLTSNGSSRKYTDDQLTSQVSIFFVAGFETSSSGIVMTLHELVINPEVQEKLYQEFKQYKETKGTLTYENINDLKYLDCVLNEGLRKWTGALFMDRECTKPYELPPPREGGKPYQMKKGDILYNMVNTIHMDPKYFPEPEKFIPERFSEENRHKIKPFTFMPFGMGPRSCIGTRFALLEMKALLYHLVLNFKFLRGSKTLDPIVLDANDFNVKVKGGSWLRVEPRK